MRSILWFNMFRMQLSAMKLLLKLLFQLRRMCLEEYFEITEIENQEFRVCKRPE